MVERPADELRSLWGVTSHIFGVLFHQKIMRKLLQKHNMFFLDACGVDAEQHRGSPSTISLLLGLANYFFLGFGSSDEI